MPFAWAMYDDCTSLTPGGAANCRQSGSFSRYDLMNIYATVTVNDLDWHLVGPGQWTVQTNLSIVHPAPPTVFPWRWIGVSTYEHNLVAYEGERPVMAWRLARAGFSARDIWDIAAVTGFFNMTNRLATATDMMPNLEYHARSR